jgi:uroporphyrinogen III methyltransferase/synthase
VNPTDGAHRGDATPIDPAATLIVTRPQPDAQKLIDALKTRGRSVIAFPVIAIEPVADDGPLVDAMKRIDDYRLVIFVSPNAIRRALASREGAWPHDVTIGVMGPGSVETLRSLGIATPGHRVVAPRADATRSGANVDRFDSESLFAALDDTLNLSRGFDGRVLILRGNGGRAWFADRLRGLDITVDEVEAYRRVRPVPDANSSTALTNLMIANERAAFIVTSSEGVDNLIALVEQVVAGATGLAPARGRSWLHASTIIAPHRRIAEKARQSGFLRILVCAPGDRGILAAIE